MTSAPPIADGWLELWSPNGSPVYVWGNDIRIIEKRPDCRVCRVHVSGVGVVEIEAEPREIIASCEEAAKKAAAVEKRMFPDG